MLTAKDLNKYREIIMRAMEGMGRDDIGIGEVSEKEHGVLAVEFSRGTHSSIETVSTDALQDRVQTNQAILRAIGAFSKTLARSHD